MVEEQHKERCTNCGSRNVHYDIIDLVGDGIEKDFGKTTVVCSNQNCGLVLRIID